MKFGSSQTPTRLLIGVAALAFGLVACTHPEPVDQDPAAVPAPGQPAVAKSDPYATYPAPGAPGTPVTTPTMGTVSLSRVEPSSVRAGSMPQGLSVTITGLGFASGAQVAVNDVIVPAVITSPTSLTVLIPGDKLAVQGMVTLAIVGSTPDVRSNPLTFTVFDNVTSLVGMDPISATVRRASTSAFPLLVRGSGFAADSAVLFNGTQVATVFENETSLRATIPSDLMTHAGQVNVVVRRGSALTTPLVFTILSDTGTGTGASCGNRGRCSDTGLKTGECTGEFPVFRCGSDGCMSLVVACF